MLQREQGKLLVLVNCRNLKLTMFKCRTLGSELPSSTERQKRDTHSVVEVEKDRQDELGKARETIERILGVADKCDKEKAKCEKEREKYQKEIEVRTNAEASEKKDLYRSLKLVEEERKRLDRNNRDLAGINLNLKLELRRIRVKLAHSR